MFSYMSDVGCVPIKVFVYQGTLYLRDVYKIALPLIRCQLYSMTDAQALSVFGVEIMTTPLNLPERSDFKVCKRVSGVGTWHPARVISG